MAGLASSSAEAEKEEANALESSFNEADKEVEKLHDFLHRAAVLGPEERRALLGGADEAESGAAVWRRLAPSEALPWLECARQYLLVSSAPAEEAAFRSAALLHGTTWLFHGSPLSNWASIARRGLRSLSRTPGMANGAAHGDGVYFHREPRLPILYAKRGELANSHQRAAELLPHPLSNCPRTQTPARTLSELREPSAWLAVALCEVVRSPALHGTPSEGTLRLSDESHCATRLLLLYPRDRRTSLRLHFLRLGASEEAQLRELMRRQRE